MLALRRIAAGQVVRVVSRGSPTRIGPVFGVYNDRFVLWDGQAIDSLPVTGVDSVWVRQSSKIGIGAAVGAVAGALIAGEAQYGSQNAACSYADIGSCIGTWVLGAGFGALVGAGVGAVFPSWRRRFPN